MSAQVAQAQVQGLGCLLLCVVAFVGGLWAKCSPSKPKPLSPERQAEIAESQARMDKLQAELEHPLVKAAFQAGYAFGQQHKGTGLTRLTERELDNYALLAAQKLNVPANLLGHAVRKFKNGYGWGYWNTR
jgi:hypothetical protein